MHRLILKKHTGATLGLYLGVGGSDVKNNKKYRYDGGIGFASVFDFFNYPIVHFSEKKPKFYITDSFYVVDNTTTPLVYKVCFIGDEEGHQELINNVKRSSQAPEVIISATDSNFRIALILDNINIEINNIEHHKIQAQKACDFIINYINIYPEKIKINESCTRK